MKNILIFLIVILLSGCGSQGIRFRETKTGIVIQPVGKKFMFFSPKLSPGKYEYSNGEKKASADFKKEPMKLLDLNFSGLKK